MIAKSLLVDFSVIKHLAEIDNFEKLCNALKDDTSFTVFKNTNKRMLQSLKYIPERKGGKFRNLFQIFANFVITPK